MKKKIIKNIFFKVVKWPLFLLFCFCIFLEIYYIRNIIPKEFKNFIYRCRVKNETNESDFFVGEKLEKPKISIIIPIFNRALYLENLICSLENQSLKDLEIIFVDDYSTDNSSKKIKYYMKKDKRMLLIKNTKNKGVFHSRYLASLFSRGIYLYFLDPDDLLSNILGEAYDLGEKYNLDIVEFLYVRYENGSYRICPELRESGRGYIRINEDIKYYMFLNSYEDKNKNKLYRFSHGLLWEKIIKREVVLKAYSKIGEKYLNCHLVTWDDSLISFLFIEKQNHINILKNLDILGISVQLVV